MKSLIDKLTIEDVAALTEEQQLLVECVGLETYKKLLKEYSGVSFHVGKAESITKEIRNRLIYDEFDGKNIKQLAVKYGLTQRSIYAVLSEMRSRRQRR